MGRKTLAPEPLPEAPDAVRNILATSIVQIHVQVFMGLWRPSRGMRDESVI